MAENCILSENVKKVFFFVFLKTTFSAQDSFKIFVFYIILLDFSSILAILKVRLNDVEMVLFLLRPFSHYYGQLYLFLLFSKFYNFV